MAQDKLDFDVTEEVNIVFSDGQSAEFPGVDKLLLTPDDYVLQSAPEVTLAIPRNQIKYVMTGAEVSVERVD